MHHHVEKTLVLEIAGREYLDVEACMMFDRDGVLVGLETDDVVLKPFDVMQAMKTLTPMSAEWHLATAILMAARAYLDTDDGIAAGHAAMQSAMAADRQTAKIRTASLRAFGEDYS